MLSLCSDTREVKDSECASLCNVLCTAAKERQCVSHPAGSVGPSGTFSLPHPLHSLPPPTTLAHVEDTADGCPGVRRAFSLSLSLFFNKQCLPETCSSHSLLLGAGQMVLACWLPFCSLCSQRRGGKWHQGDMSSNGVKLQLIQLQLQLRTEHTRTAAF